jgi:hypothetical protein
MKLNFESLTEDTPLAVRLAYAAGWVEGLSIASEPKRVLVNMLLTMASRDARKES